MGKKRDFFKAFMGYQYLKNSMEDNIENAQDKWNNENLKLQMCELVADMTALYDYVTEVSGFKDAVREDIQLIKDLWLYTIIKCVQIGFADLFEIENIAQNLIDELEIEHSISVSEYIDNMDRNESYKTYITSVFGDDLIYPGLFWEILASMNGRAKDGKDDVTVSFVKKYIDFLKVLGHYFQICDIRKDYESLIQAYIDEFLDKQVRIGKGIDSYQDHSLLNPLIGNEEDNSCPLVCAINISSDCDDKINYDIEKINISNDLLVEEYRKRYDVNQVVWDNNYVRVTYVGIVKQGNYWGIKMLIENKMSKPLTLKSNNICMDNFVVTTSSIISHDLPAHRKIFAEASMMFSDLEELGVNCIEDMHDIELTLVCEVGFEMVAETSPMLLCANKYAASESNIKKLDKKPDTVQLAKKETSEIDRIYVSKKDELVWENEFLQIVYKGIYKGGNYWGILFSLDNKTNSKISVGTSNIEMENQIVDVLSYIEYDLKPFSKVEQYISIGFDVANDLGIMNVNDFRDMKLQLCCEKEGEKIAQSPQIIIHPVDYLKEIHMQMSGIMDEIDAGEIWKKNEEEFPKTVEFVFVYPNGKHGDVDLQLISQWGEFEQISTILFRARLSTEKLYIIELMILFYHTQFSQNALLINRNDDAEAIKFLAEYNNIMKLQGVYEIAAGKTERKEILENPIMQKAYNIIKNKYKELKDKRSEIYAEIVANNGASSKWKSEQQVYAIARNEYEDAIYQYHTEWLGRQSLDVYIPSLSIAIEYQGMQHYEPLDIFGGEEKFKVQQQRDKKKKLLCAENGVKLIEWKYDIVPCIENFQKMIKASLED